MEYDLEKQTTKLGRGWSNKESHHGTRLARAAERRGPNYTRTKTEKGK